MKHTNPITAFFLIALAAIQAGCCNPSDHDTPPAAITADEQIARLNARAAAVQTLKAKGRVSIEWRDKDGGHRQTADALLLLARNEQLANAFAPAANVRLLGTFSGTEVFEIGVNTQYRWTAFRVDPKKAYVGRVGVGTASHTYIDPFRADRILEVLGLIALPTTPSPTQRVTMTARDKPAPPANEISLYVPNYHNTLLIPNVLQRVEVINRRTGDIDEIRLYHDDGSLEARAVLSDYADGGTGIRLPRRITVSYPGQQASVDLALTSLRLNVDLPPNFATMPDFKEQGLEVVDTDKNDEP